jgi:hypothetical protein
MGEPLKAAWAEEDAIGDLRNKYAKIERDERHRAYLARRYPPKPKVEPTCRCGLTWHQTTLYSHTEVKLSRRHLNGLWCTVCMPHEVKMELIDIMITQGIKYDPEEHGDSL